MRTRQFPSIVSSKNFFDFCPGTKVYRNAVPARYSSQSLHENYETGCGLIEKPRGSLDHLSRRHFDHSFFSRNIEPSQKISNRLARASGIPDKLQEVKSHFIPTDCVLRDVSRFGINAVRIASNQSCANSKECRLLLNSTTPTIRHLSRVLGLLESCRPAIWSAPLHYRHLQTLQITALQRWSKYNASICLTPTAKIDLAWWITPCKYSCGVE
jgi:hypothetical protein